MRRLFILYLALSSVCAVAETYRWLDAAGHPVFSDTPPAGKVKDVVKAGGNSEPGDGLPFATRKAAADFPVTLYTSTDCVANCKQARDLLNGRGIPFTEKMLQSQADFDELKNLVGDAFVPTLKVGKQTSRGFEAVSYNNLLDLAGYPKTAAFGSKPSGGLSK